MKSRRGLFLLATLVTLSIHSNAKETSKFMWFHSDNYSSLEIRKHKSPSTDGFAKTLVIQDPLTIEKFRQDIEKIPPNGDEMISFSPIAVWIELVFHGTKNATVIDVFNNRFKTPSTGFNSNRTAVETRLAADIDGLLSPEINKTVLKVRDLVLNFKDFTVTYIGQESSGEQPTTVSITRNLYSIADQAGNKQLIRISSGQIAPQPFEFDVNHKKMILLTQENEATEPLYPNYFKILKGHDK